MRIYRDDQKFMNLRINIVAGLITAVFAFLAASFWWVQGLHAEKYRNLSEANALRSAPIRAKRGLIMDRNGKILADNQAAYALVLSRTDLKKIARTDKTFTDRMLRFVAATLDIPLAEVQARIDRGKILPLNQPLPLADDLTIAQVAQIQSNRLQFPVIDIDPVQRRNYRYGTMAAHVLGYMGETTEKDLARDPSLKLGDFIGKKGVEFVYDNVLRGTDGARYTVVDSHGRPVEEYTTARKDPVPGHNVYLTLDFDLQRAAEQYFIDNEFVGSAVVLDPKTGEVLAMVSSPSFNPNVFSKRFTPDVWATITSNPFHLLQNRAIQGLYSPGSVFKVVMAMAGLADKAIGTGTTFDCGGSAVFFGRRFHCWKKQGHGSISVENALKVSCDIFFYNTGAKLGLDRIAEYAKNLTFGKVSGIDLEGEMSGLVPSTEWAATKQHRKWYPSETISVAIGQGPLVVTVLQVANMMAAIANGGNVHRPHVLKAIEDITPEGRKSTRVVEPQVISHVNLPANALDAVRTGLWKVVNEEGGTAGNARVEGLDISGKTGTVQVTNATGTTSTASMPFKFRDHAWFASFAPKNKPELVVVVFIEHAGHHGGTDAAPLAKLLYESHFRSVVANRNLNLTDPNTLEQLRQGELPQPGQVRKEEAAPLGSDAVPR
jgi:penicillin-binding protein 2